MYTQKNFSGVEMFNKLKEFFGELKKSKNPDWERMFCLGAMRFPLG